MQRRHFLTSAAGLSAAALPVNTATAADETYYVAKNGRIKQSVILWCFNPMPVEELAAGSAKMASSRSNWWAPSTGPR